MHDPSHAAVRQWAKTCAADVAPLPAPTTSLRCAPRHSIAGSRSARSTKRHGRCASRRKRFGQGYYRGSTPFGNVTHANPNPRILLPTPEFESRVGRRRRSSSWTPNDAFALSAAAAEPEARAAQTEKQKLALSDGVKLEVMQAYQALHEAEVAIGTTQRGLRAAEEGYRVRRELFRNGRRHQRRAHRLRGRALSREPRVGQRAGRPPFGARAARPRHGPRLPGSATAAR